MSKEAVNQFLQKVSEDAQLQAEVAQAMESENDRQVVTDLAAKHGYQFTPEELGQEIQNRENAAAASGELDEEELEAVAGGALTLAVVLNKTMVICGLPPGPSVPRAKW